jgi:outer membrane protein assembly factor BamA/autotransporter translocation and assembly factor TamB
MSGPTYPGPASAGPARASAWRRLLRRLLGALVVLVALVVLLQSPPVRRLVSSALTGAAARALGGEVALERLDYRIWAGEASLRGLLIRRPGLQIECARADLSVGPFEGVHVAIDSPRVTVTVAPGDEVSPPAEASHPWAVLHWLSSGVLERGHLEVHDRAGTPWLRFDGVEARLGRQGGERRGAVRVAAAGIGWPGGGIRLEPVRAEADVTLDADARTIRLVRARAETEGAAIQASGRLEQLRPLVASGEAEGSIEARVLRRLAPSFDAEGRVEARVEVASGEGGARGSVTASTPGFTAFSVGPWAGALRGRLEGACLVVEQLDLRGYGGQATASGALALGEGRSELDVRVRGMDVGALARAFASGAPALAATADADASVAIAGWSAPTLEGRGRVVLRPAGGTGWPLAGEADLRLANERLSFSTDSLRAREARAELRGMLTFEKDVEVAGALRLEDASGLPALLADAGVGAPPLSLAGSLVARGEAHGRLPAVEATAQIATAGLAVDGVDLDLSAALRLTPVGIEIGSLVLQGPDGNATASGFVHLQPDRRWDVHAEIPELVLTDALARHGVPLPAVVKASLRVQGPLDAPEAAFAIDSRLGATEEAPAGEVHASGRLSSRGFTIDRLTSEIGGGAVDASGVWDRARNSLEGRLTAKGVSLAEIPWNAPPAILSRAGSILSGEVRVRGRPAHPEGEATITFSSNALRGEPLPDLTLQGHSDGSAVRFSGRLGEAPLLSGQLLLADPWPVRAEVDLAALPLGAFLGAAAPEGARTLRAELEGHATLEAPLFSPRQLRYQADVERLALHVARDWWTAPFALSGDLESLSVRGFALTDGRSRLRVEGGIGPGAGEAGSLALRGEVPLEDFADLLPEWELAGDVTLDLRLRGELTAPDVEGALTVANGSGRVGALRWQDLQLEGSARSGVLTLERARARVAGGEVSAEGSLPVGPHARETQTLEIRLKGVDLGTLVPPAAGAPTLVAPLDLSARVRATAPRLEAVEADGKIETFSGSVGDRRFVLMAPVAWRWSHAKLRHDPIRLRGDRGEVEIEGALDLSGKEPAARLRVAGVADLAFLDPFFGGALRLSGPAHLDLRASRGREGLRLDGEARVDGGRLRLREPPLVVTDLGGRVEAGGRSARLVDIHGRVGTGHVRAEGRVVLAPTGPDAALTLSADQVPITYPQGLRSRVSGNVSLEGREGRYRLGGEVTVGRAVFDRDVDSASRSLDAVDSELRAFDARGSLLERVRLDLRVRLEDGLRVQNRQAQLVVDGAMTVGGDLVTPEVGGSLSIREGGEVKLSRANLRIVQGRVELEGFPSRSPVLDVSGMTQVTGVRIEAQLSGPLDDLQTSLSSPNRSDLTQGDLATLILTGRTAQAAASESGAIVAEEVASALGEALDQKLGGAVFVDVSRDESLIVEDTDPTQRFNVGIPLGPRLYVVYSQPLDRGSRRWILDLRPRGNLRVKLISDEDGSAGLEIGNRKSFDLWSRARRPSSSEEKRPRVHTTVVTGVPDPEAADLLRRAKLGPGDEYDYFVGEKAAQRIAARLIAETYRTAVVETSEEEAGPTTVDVVFRVERGPRITVEWSGDDPGKRAHRRVAGAWDSYLPPEEAATRLAREVQRELQAQGHYQATVEAHTKHEGDEIVVRFDVARGARGRGVDVAFEGLKALRPETLAAALPPRDTPAFFALLEPEGRSRLETTLRGASARAGFLSLRTLTPRFETDAKSGRLIVTIPIEEGARANVIALDVPEEARSSDTPPRLRLRSGEPFSIDAYVDDRGTLASWYREQGYPDARVVGVLEPAEGGLAVRFAVDAGPRPRVGAVRLARGGRTRPGVVEEAVTLAPGDLIRPTDLAESRDRLSETRAFRSVDVRTEAKGAGEVRDVVVDLVERPDLDVEYSLRYTTSGTGEVGGAPSGGSGGQLQLGGAIQAANPFGWAHRYRLYGLAGTKRTLFGASFDAATFFGRRWRTQVFLFDDEDRDLDIPQLGQHVRGVALQQTKRWRTDIEGRRWHDRLLMQWGYSFRRIGYTDLETGDQLGGNRGGVSDSLIGDTRDSLTDPHQGRFWTAGAEVALRALGSQVDYVRLFGQFFLYVPLGPRVVWAQGVRYGFAPGDDPLLLLERRFQAGGATTVRGFAENSLGPKYKEEPIGGQAMFVFNEELRFPIWKTFFGGVFYDAGNVWGLSREVDLRLLRQGAGVGLRLMFPFGPVRLDWAHVLDPREGEDRSRWHFSIGHAF